MQQPASSPPPLPTSKAALSTATVSIEDVPVAFPFKPYPAQVTYMEKVIQALQSRSNALLESPTGTGKTLSLLCSTLAWQQTYDPAADPHVNAAGGVVLKYEQENAVLARPPVLNGGGGGGAVGAGVSFKPGGGKERPAVVYASRTHSQLTQVVKELKSTTYRPRTGRLGGWV